MSSFKAFREARTESARTQPLQAVMNTSVVHDPEINSTLLSNSTNLTNNYAPLEKVMDDTLRKRNTHPLARYIEDIPFFQDSFYNAKPLVELASAQGKQILKNKGIRPHGVLIDMPRLNGSEAQLKSDVITQSKFETDYKPDVNGFGSGNVVRLRQQNKKALDNIAYVQSGVGNDTRRKLVRLQELQHNYPITNEALVQHEQPRATLIREEFSPKPKTLKIIAGDKEGFTRMNEDDSYLDQVYIQSLESRILAVIHYVMNNQSYDKWKANWAALDKTLKKNDFKFSRLTVSDADVAYTVNKGESTRFRIRDKDMRYVPLNIYQYVLLHECAHIANFNKWGHGKEFQCLLSLLCLASYELGFIDLRRMQKSVYLSNGQPILCQRDMKNEILHGINEVVDANPELRDHYKSLSIHISNQ